MFQTKQRMPFSAPGFVPQMQIPTQQAVTTQPPECNLLRAMQFPADYSGCGAWRMLWPETILNLHSKMVIHTSTVMNLDVRNYVGAKAVRIQRQATAQQLEFAKFLKEVSKHNGMRVIYEVDDAAFISPNVDIPRYNKYRPAFDNPEIQRCMREIVNLCDEVTTTCPYLANLITSETGNKNVTVIPNFMPKFWIGNHCDISKNMANLDIYKKRPRIFYAGSGAHFDVDNKNGGKDDFTHVVDVIRKTSQKYKWVVLGAFPLPLIDLITNGTIEFHPWTRLYEYGQKISDLNVNMMIAPLMDNDFNKSKSDLKHIEAGAFGLPIACQDLVTYENAPIKFKTGDEMIDQIDRTLKDPKFYKAMCKKGRAVAEDRWLELDKNIDCYVELFTTPYGSPDRKNLARYNKV